MKVTMKDDAGAGLTPTAQAIKNAIKETAITDAEGREIKLRKPGVLSTYRLVESLGGEVAGNQTYMNMVLPLLYVVEIDGDPVFEPGSKLEVEALVQRLDDHGINAVINGVVAMSGNRDPEADKAAIKK